MWEKLRHPIPNRIVLLSSAFGLDIRSTLGLDFSFVDKKGALASQGGQQKLERSRGRKRAEIQRKCRKLRRKLREKMGCC
ncbi:hypothetical protein SLEP1_g12525 [Rubroshorea leprosula]|uniref:Uncharacterized protein n=1 Tax=Rubroshorea leprosula TaxID=152421 RepID=A0AAV5ICU5_9ROSI|nr:hypothetical protein SLEP1_g12525 [Rubroshorea leprosula]